MRRPGRNPPRIHASSALQSQLLTLPTEIRIIIYTILFVSCDVLCPNVKTLFASVQAQEESQLSFLTFPHEQTLAIARTCRVIHDEALPIYFGSNKFMFRDTWDMQAYLYMIGDRQTLIKNISFAYRGLGRKEAFELLSNCTGLNRLDVMVSNETMKGARKPQDDLFQAQGMRVLMSIRGLVACKVTVREVVAIRTGSWMDPKLVFSSNVGERRRFNEKNIRAVEKVLAEEIGKNDKEEVILTKEHEEVGGIQGESVGVLSKARGKGPARSARGRRGIRTGK